MVAIEQHILRVHDLVRFAAPAYEAELPAWTYRSGDSVWGVVRRQSAHQETATSVGLRGRQRSERLPLDVRDADIIEVVAPEALSARLLSDAVNPGLSMALSVLSGASRDRFGGRVWGPTGSAGFELATGIPVVREVSDLDMILRVDEPLAHHDARMILRFLRTLPCRVDCLLETDRGAVALAEWARPARGRVLLRSPNGPVMTEDPWREDVE